MSTPGQSHQRARRSWLYSFASDPVRALRPTRSADDDILWPGSSIGQRRDYRRRYVLMGLVLAFGAPLGALLLRSGLREYTLVQELTDHAFFYIYTLVGTGLVFGVGGFIAGTIADTLARDRDRFLELSEHDELTGLLNARAFWDSYRRAVEKAVRFREPLSLLVIDVDQLKHVNDSEGHRFGNLVLQHVANQVLGCKRSDDIASRWGGDEFVILMPGASTGAAVRVAESVVEAVRGNPVRTHRTEKNVTVTVGVASASAEQNAQGLFDRADAALYVGKRQGGNQYQLAREGSG